MRRSVQILLASLAFVGGCQTKILRDPNDPTEAGVMAPEVLQRNLKSIADNLFQRQAAGEITDDEYQQYIEQAARELLAKVHIDKIAPTEAWQYLEVLRAAKRWKEAEEVGRIAVKWAKERADLDRLVNDTLRLAETQAAQGRVGEAIATARSVFSVPDEAAAPILMATLYEIVPLAQGKGEDEALAELVEDAIACHWRTKVDAHSESGATFLAVRMSHIRKGWHAVIELYKSAGKGDLAHKAAERAKADLERVARV